MNLNAELKPLHVGALFVTAAILVTGCGDLFENPDKEKLFTAAVTVKNDCMRSGIPPAVGVAIAIDGDPFPSSTGRLSFNLSFGDSETAALKYRLPDDAPGPVIRIQATVVCYSVSCRDASPVVGILDYNLPSVSETEHGAIIHNTFAVSEMDNEEICLGI